MDDKRKMWREVLSPLYWDAGKLVMLDQRQLPTEEVWISYDNYEQVAQAIRDMVIRGAPAIGCAAALGVALGAQSLPNDPVAFKEGFDRVCRYIAAARPTAVNLFWAVERQQKLVEQMLRDRGVLVTREALIEEGLRIWQEDIACCQQIGRLGAELIPDNASVLTHCNAGALATGGYGTALGVIRAAIAAGKKIKVYADETRPFLQGARLTAWELHRSGIEVTLIPDVMAGALMKQGQINCIVVGADRIARNGDTANKIGTFTLGVLAKYHGIPLYVAAPRSTIDLQIASGEEITIEERPAREVTHVGSTQIVPDGVPVRNMAFDVTDHHLVSAIITEAGIARPPYESTIPTLFEGD